MGSDSVMEYEVGPYGVRAIVHGPWTVELTREATSRGVVDIELNHAKGWSGTNIEFVTQLPQLRAITVIDFKLTSVQPLHQLSELRYLKFLTYCKTPIDFRAFRHLTHCSMHWRRGCDSLFDVARLESLFILGYKGVSLEPFSRLRALATLNLVSGPFRSLSGIGVLSNLRYLRIAALTKLTSIDGLEKLRDIEDIRIDSCNAIESFAPLGGCEALRILTIGSCGSIPTIAFVKNLKNLEQFVFDGTSNVMDGDLSGLTHLPKLRRLFFKRRRHYSHTKEQCLGRHDQKM